MTGVQTCALPISSVLDSDVRAAYDVIGFDPRGIGGSTPITCWSEEELDAVLAQASGGTLVQPDESTVDPADTTTVDAPQLFAGERVDDGDVMFDAAYVFEHGRTMVAKCEQYSKVPAILDHMSTNDVVRDLDLMRAVVGDDTLNYLGISYGTEIGAEYLEEFPLNAGAVVLDSAVDPSIHRQQQVDDTIAHYEYQLRTFVEHWQDTVTSPLTGTPEEGKNQLGEWIAGLAADPLPVDGTTDTIDATTAFNWITDITVMAHRDYWPTLMDGLADAMSTGDGTALAQAYTSIKTAQSGGQRVEPVAVAPSREGIVAVWNALYASYAVDCTGFPALGLTQIGRASCRERV